MSVIKKYLFAITGLLLIASCDQQSSQNGEADTSANTPELVRISGVSSKGPISAATIEVVAFDASDGSESGVPLAMTTTDGNGRWSVNISAANHSQPLLIKSSGGEYLDESDAEADPTKKRRISLSATDTLYGVLFPGFDTSSVTMITSAVVDKSRLEANGSDFLNVLTNNQNIAASAIGFDPFTVGAANPLAPDSGASIDSIEYAMLLGGMATALNSAAILMGAAIPDFAVIQGFIEDMMDGQLNGQNQNGAISVMVNGVATAFPATIDLNQAIIRFRNNNYAAYVATPVSDVMEVDENLLATSGVNVSPVAQDDALTTIAGSSAITGDVLANDSDPDGDSLSISNFTQAANGQVVNNNDHTFTYTPDPGYDGSDIFTYTISDGHGGSDSAQVIITVSAISANTPPVAVNDSVTTAQDIPLTTQNLLSNDSDPDGDSISVSGFTQPINGLVINNNNGTFGYTPSAGFSGSDSFTYSISDGNGGAATASVSITVIAASPNLNPIANAGIDQSVSELTTITLAGSGTDSDGTISSYQWSQANGTAVTLANAGTSTASFVGPQVLGGNIDVLVFQLTVTDNSGGEDVDFITIIVNPANLPTANAGTDQTLNEQLPVNLDGSASSDDGAIVGYSWIQIAGSPGVTLNNANTATPDFSGPDIANDTTFTFQLTVTDDEGGTDTDTVNINLVSLNTGPTLGNDLLENTVENTPVLLNTLLNNDSDPQGHSFTIDSVTQPANGAVVIEANNLEITYTPDLNFTGADTFTYTAIDQHGAISSNTATVTVTVSAASANTAPVAVNDSVITAEDTPLTTQDLLSNDSDADGDALSVSGFTQAANGLVINNNNGTFDYTPSSGFSGSDSFTYSISDGNGGADTASVAITVTPAGSNLNPTANAGTDQSVNELSTVTLTGSGIDSDGTISSYQWSQVNGTAVTINNGGTNTASFASPEVLVGNIDVLVFQLTVTDNSGGTGVDFVTVIVNPVAIAPTANAGIDQTLNEQLPVNLNGSASSDDRSVVGYSWVQTAGSPTIILTGANTATPSFPGPDIANSTTFTFELTVTDDEGGTGTDTVNINLISLNAGPTLGNDPLEGTAEDTPVVLTTLLNNDSDPEGDSFTIDSVTQPANGSVVIEANDLDITYTPTLNFNGTDTFTYTAIDSNGALSSNSATVTVTVTGSNDDPTAVTDNYSVTQGFPLIISDLTANDTDPDGDTLTITGVTQPGNGVSVNNGDGTVTYTPDVLFNGADSFTYTVVDGNAGSATGTVNITIIADSDGDGIIDTDEGPGGTGTDPNLADSDSDGFFDGHEILVGTNPNLNTDFPPTTTISSGNANNVISADTTWALSTSPYLLTSDVTVQSGATLTIEPGVVIKSVNNVDISISAGGLLNAIGNAPLPQQVVFTSDHDDSINGDTNLDGIATTPTGNDWGGIDYNLNSGGTTRYAIVKYAGDCIRVVNSSPVLDHIELGDCWYYGIDFQASSSSTRTANLSNIDIIDYNGDGTATGYSGIRVLSSSSATTVLNLNNLTMTEPGNTEIMVSICMQTVGI